MGPFTIYSETNQNSTIVPNRFIDEYMKNANDAQIKVYLYLIRSIGANKAISVEDIADQFNHTEKDVIRALKYWEKLHLLSIDYDASGDITGIHMQDLSQPVMKQPIILTKEAVSSIVKESKEEKTTSPQPALPASDEEEPVNELRTNNITKERLRALNTMEEFQSILFITEQYLGKMLTVPQIKGLAYMYDTLHMSVDLIDFLVEYCVERGKTSHLYMEKVANNWADENITTVEQAKATISMFDSDIYEISKALGNYNAPTKAEASLIHKWIHTYQFSKEIILLACERTVLATNTGRIRYADKILNDWHLANVQTKSDIDALDAAFAGKTTKARTQKQASKPNGFNEFSQRSYDYDELEKKLLKK